MRKRWIEAYESIFGLWGRWGHLRSFKAIEANSLTRGQVRLFEVIKANWGIEAIWGHWGQLRPINPLDIFSARKLLRFCLFSKNSLNFQTTVNIFRIVFWIYLHSGWKKARNVSFCSKVCEASYDHFNQFRRENCYFFQFQLILAKNETVLSIFKPLWKHFQFNCLLSSEWMDECIASKIQFSLLLFVWICLTFFDEVELRLLILDVFYRLMLSRGRSNVRGRNGLFLKH